MDSYDDIKDLSERDNTKFAFIKKLDKGYAVVVELSKENDKIILHKTFSIEIREVKESLYKNKPSILKKWSVDGSTTISPVGKQQPADIENISALDHSKGKGTTESSNEQGNGEKTTQSGSEQRFKVGNTWYGRDKQVSGR